jgi:RimJ/RimL family protein N-acetyltransferase
MAQLQTRLNAIDFVRRVGPAGSVRAVLEQGWYTKLFFGLRADLANLPDVRPAKVPIAMTARDVGSYGGFERELDRVSGPDYIEVLFRIWSCRAEVQTLYVADGPDGEPAYAQWLVRPDDQDLIHAHAPGRYSRLAADEVLLEGAYTFAAYRRMGMMNDGMGQLLRLARDEGYAAAITYVGADNVASLRGCANVGFALDHVRHNERRLARRRSIVGAPDEEAQRQWEAAVAPRAR